MTVAAERPAAVPPPTQRQPRAAAIDVVIPALNEERSLPLVLADLPHPPVRRVVVADNGSRRRAPPRRRAAAAPSSSTRRGAATAAPASPALDWLRRNEPPDVVVFVDADYSDHPDELPRLVAPILDGRADLVIGSRVLGEREPRRPPPPGAGRQPGRLPPDPPPLRPPLHRPRPLPRRPLGSARAAGDGRPRLRLDGRDAGQGAAPRAARRRGPGLLPPPRRASRRSPAPSPAPSAPATRSSGPCSATAPDNPRRRNSRFG